MNVRSVKNKTLYLCDYIATTNSDFVALSETWFNSEEDNDTYINSLLPAGYVLYCIYVYFRLVVHIKKQVKL